MLDQNSTHSKLEITKANVHCYRKDAVPLVFVATYKCASTYYKTLLLDNGWHQINFDAIDWSLDRVFSFISNPEDRYIKGIVQDLLNAEDPVLDEKILDLLQNYKKHVLVLTDHSTPIMYRFKDYAEKIDWIPIGDDFPTHEMFIKLLSEYGLTAEPGENLDPHIANGAKRDLYKKYQDAFGDKSDLYNIAVAGNIDLFNRIRDRINHRGNTWHDISWLNKP